MCEGLRPLPAGDRRLLLHKREIRKLEKATEQAGLTIVPLRCYFNDASRVKVDPRATCARLCRAPMMARKLT